MTTLTPALAKAIAIALPIPDVPPVTSATLPSKLPPMFPYNGIVILIQDRSSGQTVVIPAKFDRVEGAQVNDRLHGET